MVMKTFGLKRDDQVYRIRVGVHLVISDSERNKILLVSPPNGSYLLPGGEIEENETHEETAKRESMEELGFEIEVGQFIGEAEEYYYSKHRKQHYHNPAYFYICKSWESVCEPLEDFNQLEWVSISEALTKLKRGSHKWAVKQYESSFLKTNQSIKS
ncbi:NUDIX domain-containing protein [Carnobacterium sp. ISL-102]|uniref:NUDIX domain-containing protein n=1 Tax=Carnobacterium sp. ISL-102 TaxID=2819142 RepID=UPI001BEA1910|nr:NUDIX domain-containing protein [Carnobacterium sp. ISL-102]MBT2732234.1 NUDIX domain-containing protein [Carnobacterium sp. ISL-102]